MKATTLPVVAMGMFDKSTMRILPGIFQRNLNASALQSCMTGFEHLRFGRLE